MRTRRFPDERIMAARCRAESGVAVPELCRKRGIGTACFPQGPGHERADNEPRER